MSKKLQNLQPVTKADLEKVEKRFDGRADKIVERIDGVEEKLDNNQNALNAKLDKLQNTLDGFVGRVDDLTIENQVGTNQISELREQVGSHEERIASLESSQQHQ